jgi:hypothetical protein
MPIVEIVGVAAAISLLVALWARPAGLFAVFVALVITGTAILVSWNDVEQVRQERAVKAAFQQELATSSPAVKVPPSVGTRAGS